MHKVSTNSEEGLTSPVPVAIQTGVHHLPTTEEPKGPTDPVPGAIQKILDYHASGVKSLVEHPKRVPHTKSSEKLRKSRAVARSFDARDLVRLTELCLKEGMPLGQSHLDRLVT